MIPITDSWFHGRLIRTSFAWQNGSKKSRRNNSLVADLQPRQRNAPPLVATGINPHVAYESMRRRSRRFLRWLGWLTAALSTAACASPSRLTGYRELQCNIQGRVKQNFVYSTFHLATIWRFGDFRAKSGPTRFEFWNSCIWPGQPVAIPRKIFIGNTTSPR